MVDLVAEYARLVEYPEKEDRTMNAWHFTIDVENEDGSYEDLNY